MNIEKKKSMLAAIQAEIEYHDMQIDALEEIAKNLEKLIGGNRQDSQRPERGSMKNQSNTDIARFLLESGGSIHTNQLAERIIDLRGTKKNKAKLKRLAITLFSQLTKQPDIFVKTGKSMWALRNPTDAASNSDSGSDA